MVRRSRSGTWLVLEVAGEMDFEAGRSSMMSATTRASVVFDLHGVTSMDCSSLRVLQNAQRRACAAGGTLRLAAASRLLRILALTRLDRAFAKFDTVRDAISLPVTARRRSRGSRCHPERRGAHRALG